MNFYNVSNLFDKILHNWEMFNDPEPNMSYWHSAESKVCVPMIRQTVMVDSKVRCGLIHWSNIYL